MFRTDNCSSSGGLYKQLTAFHHALFEYSSRNRTVSATRLPIKMHGEIL